MLSYTADKHANRQTNTGESNTPLILGVDSLITINRGVPCRAWWRCILTCWEPASVSPDQRRSTAEQKVVFLD